MTCPGAPLSNTPQPPGRSGQAPAARLSRFRRVAGGLLCFSLTLAAIACNATPLPEPPALVDLSKVTPPETFNGPVVGEGTGGGVALGLSFEGAPGAAPPHSSVSVTNLDSTEPPIVTTAKSDGSFVVNVPMQLGDVLRFEAVTSSGRTPPSDGLMPLEPGGSLRPAPRHSCLSLEPGFSLDFTDKSAVTLVLNNGCDEIIAVTNPRFRTETVSFGWVTEFPLQIPAESSATLELEHTPTRGDAREVVLFLDVTLAGETLRYPITLYSKSP